MADDLSSFIESQKRKLEQERSEIVRTQDTEDRSRTSPRGYKPDNRHIQGGATPASETRIKAKATFEDDSDAGGLKLGGYEQHQQKLRQERKEEYRKYLAEKNFRSTGKVEPVLSDNSRSPHLAYKSREAQVRRDDKDDNDDSYQSRRRGKENYDDSAKDYDSQDRRGNRKPENLFESYEDILQRKRAQERRYRGFDDSNSGADRPMRLNAPQYKQSSRSDGYLSRRFDDDDYDRNFSRNRSRGRKEKSFESKRVRFHGDEDLDDDSWVKPRRRLDYYDDEEDEEELLEWVRKRGKRPQRRNSAHLPDREPPQDETLERSKTDSSIRSQSAPLEGPGVIGGSQESRITKAKKQEQYKKELQQQMQEQADIKKREKMLHLGVEQNSGRPLNSQLDRTPPDANRGSYPPRSQGYDVSLANHGPSSRPPPHPAIHSNPYDDPYYYYGALEMGAAPSMGGAMNSPRGTGQAGMAGLRLDAGISGGAQLQGRDTHSTRNQGYTTPTPAAFPTFPQQGGGELSPRSGLQPPGGYSSLGAVGADPGSNDKKKAAQQAYQEELRKQMIERDAKKQKEREEKDRYNRKIEQEAANYHPWGKGGAGAPLRDSTGHLVANLRTLKQYNDQGVNVSPRDQPPPVETRFEIPVANDPYLSPRQGANSQASSMPAADLSGNVNRATFGRSDPLKEAQPQDDLKKAARQEYQEYLRNQVEEKERKKKEELDRTKKEEEELERRITEDRMQMQKDFAEEQEKSRRKEEEARLKNEQIKEAQEAKKREVEKKRKDMEEQRQAELKRKLDTELAAKKAAGQGYSAQARTNSPPIPTVRKKMEEAGQDMTDFRSSSPPIPTIAKQQTTQGPVAASPPPPIHPLHEPEPVRGGSADKDVLSQLTTLRQQLKNEEKRVQQQMDHSTASTRYSEMQRAPEDLGSRRGRRDVHVFERALANKTAVVKKDVEGFSAADEFNRMKYEETSSLAGEFRSKFPDPVSTSSVLDLQQRAFLMEQEDKLASIRSDTNRPNKHPQRGGQPYQVSRRPVSRDSLLESESQFLVVDDPKQMLPIEQMSSRPRQSSARERRRWKQLEDMARNPRPNDTYKPPTPGGYSLNSVTSFNVDDVANRNEERLRRLELIQRGGGQGGRGSLQGDPDQVLQRFMDERSRPVALASRLSETSLEAETSFEPV